MKCPKGLPRMVTWATKDVLTGVGTSCQAAVLRQEDFEAAQAANGGSSLGDELATEGFRVHVPQ